VARLLAMSPNTERGYREGLAAAGLLEGPIDDLPALEVLKAALPAKVPPQQVSSLEGWTGVVTQLVARGAQPRAIYDHLRTTDAAFAGSLSAVKRLVARLQREHGVKPEDVAIPVETAPGEVAQVDFGYVGELYDPDGHVLRKAWVFVMVLGHSRHLFARVVFDQRAETWQQLHVQAFAHFGGVPATIVPDNLKAAVIRAAFGMEDDVGLHRGYRELARHYGFKVDPAPPRDPEKKGKVEAGVKYVKNNFFATIDPQLDVDAVNRALATWTNEVAGRRVHGTTRRRPLEVFESEEKPALGALPRTAFVPAIWKRAKVHRDSHIEFDRRLYSVPFRHIGEEVWVKATPDAVVVYADDERITTHARRSAGSRSTIESHLPAGRADLRHRGQDYWEQRARVLGEDVGALVQEIFAGADVASPLRNVQAIVTYLEQVPKHRANNAARRARHFDIHDYRGVKDILLKALDFEPLPTPLFPAPASPAAAPRFARPVTQMLASKKEKIA
jgi:transposase